MGKEKNAILGAQTILIWTYDDQFLAIIQVQTGKFEICKTVVHRSTKISREDPAQVNAIEFALNFKFNLLKSNKHVQTPLFSNLSG